MEDANKAMQAIVGDPITVKIGGVDTKINRMTIETHLEVMDGWVEMSSDESSSVKKPVKFMCWIVAKALGITTEELNQRATLTEALDAFPKIWEQNELGFLFQRVGKAMDALKQANAAA